MAKDPKNSKTPKKDKAPRGERFRQIRTAFTLTRQRDPRLVPWVIIAFFGVGALVFLLLTLLGTWIVINVVLALLSAMVAFMVVFGRRAQKAAFMQVEGQPGAAAWVLQGIRGDWRTTPAVAGNTQLDAVHRVIGRPGVILVGEGDPIRVGRLLAQEKKRVARVVGDAPIYDIVVGNDEEQVPLRTLSRHFMKLPRNLNGGQVDALEKRVQALGGTKTGLPKGPIPKGARLSGLERTIRRR